MSPLGAPDKTAQVRLSGPTVGLKNLTYRKFCKALLTSQGAERQAGPERLARLARERSATFGEGVHVSI
jgi:hypothetical protein